MLVQSSGFVPRLKTGALRRSLLLLVEQMWSIGEKSKVNYLHNSYTKEIKKLGEN